MTLDNWQEIGSPKKLTRNWKFKNYKQAWQLVNKISELAESANHHPDIAFGWGYLSVSLYSHDKGSITERDLDLARAIDKISLDENS